MGHDMFRSLHIAATGMAAQETQLDAIANNVANANTTGYKRQQAEFEDLLYQNARAPAPTNAGTTPPTQLQLGSGARVVATARSLSQGAITQTGNPLDLAIEGNGYLAVMRPSGDLAYTRAGNLKLDATGRLTTSDGLPVEPPITVPLNATNVTIASDGTVSVTQPNQTTANKLGQLQLSTFPNAAGLEALGHNLFQPCSASGDAQQGAPGVDGRGAVTQGSLEGSNVDVVTEMVGLINAQRGYEMNSKVIEAADAMLAKAAQIQ